MTYSLDSFKASIVSLAVAAVVAVPALSQAATYAYVNVSGDVAAVTADSATSALMIAPGIAVHSGVMLLDSQADNELLGDDVMGV